MLWLLCVVAIVGGARSSYLEFKNARPVEITFEQYLRQRPSVEQVHLTGARLDLENSVIASTLVLGRVKQAYIPLRVGSEPPDAVVDVVLVTKDPDLLDLMERAKRAEDKDSMLRLLPEYLSAREPRVIKGLVMAGAEADDTMRSRLAKMELPLAPDFVMVDENAVGDLQAGTLILLAGIAGALLLAFRKGGRKAGARGTFGGAVAPPLPRQ